MSNRPHPDYRGPTYEPGEFGQRTTFYDGITVFVSDFLTARRPSPPVPSRRRRAAHPLRSSRAPAKGCSPA
jgi:hypothetical protein